MGSRPPTQESQLDRASLLAICCKRDRCPQAQLGCRPAVCVAPRSLPVGTGGPAGAAGWAGSATVLCL